MSPATSIIGLLSYPGSPLLHPTVNSLRQMGHQNIIVISDGDLPNEKFKSIISERTQGKAIFHSFTDFEDLQVPFYFVKDHNRDSCFNLIKSLKVAILGSCGTPRKLKSQILNATPYGIVNCHPGKLPEYRGSSTVEWALTHGHPVYSTAHFMTEEYDAGPIISEVQLMTRGLAYHEIRLKMIEQQSSHLAQAIDQVLRLAKKPTDYAAQPQGKVWGVFPESRIQELLNRRF